MRCLLLAAALIAFSSCSIVPVPEVEDKPYADIPEDARPSPIGIRKIRLNIPRGTRVGSVSPRYPFICDGPWGELFGREITSQLETGELKRAFDQTLESQGYDVTGTGDILFDEEDDYARTLYSVGAKIEDIKVDLCDKGALFLGFLSRGYTGETYMKINWTVYDRLRRKTVYKTTTEGYSRLKISNAEAVGLMLDDAFASAAHNLGANEEFHALIVYGTPPSKTPKQVTADDVYTGDEAAAVIARKPLSKTPLTDTMETSRKIAVLVQSGAGHGSGFFISKDGHILTNHHVVGNAEKVRIETAGKEKKLIATVLRRDKIRDVALVQLDEIPEDLDIVTLPIRTDWPAVGEEVYAIGTPIYQKRLQDTVTKGIISAHRKRYKIFGTYMDLLQADVSIHGGNSGGPLLDQNGNIVGLSVAGIINRDGDDAEGLNFFIPIEIALQKLDIDY